MTDGTTASRGDTTARYEETDEERVLAFEHGGRTAAIAPGTTPTASWGTPWTSWRTPRCPGDVRVPERSTTSHSR